MCITFIGFTYYDTTINELLTWSGTGWINPDGTASSRVIYIKTVSDLNNLGTAGNYLLKIVGNVDLGGTNVTLPTGCVLDFQGGTITFNNTLVENSRGDISSVITATIAGTYKAGQVLYDGTLLKMKLWNGTSWVNLDGTPLA